MGRDISAVLAVALAIGGVSAARAESSKVVTRNPDWEVKPTAEVLDFYYPDLPLAVGLPGKVRLRCSVALTSALEDCRVTEERPAGLGFGTAALRMTQHMKMRPAEENGRPVGGATVTFPVDFVAPETETPSIDAGQDSLAVANADPSLRALAMARALVDQTSAAAEANFMLDWRNWTRELAEAEPAAEGDARAALLAASLEAASEVVRQLKEKRIKLLAGMLNEDQLHALLEFVTSPVGQAYQTVLLRERAIAPQGSDKEFKRLTAEFFCRETPCAPGSN